MFAPMRPDKATAMKELKRNTAMLMVWCGIIRAAPYVLHAMQKMNNK